jgi:hypothetical protein
MNYINLFYEEPDEDRWIIFDRYPRRLIRRAVRGKPRPGGHTRVFINLCLGLDKIGVSYRVNSYQHIVKHPNEVACIIGKPHLLDKIKWLNPILFGTAIFSHPSDDPDLFTRLPIRKVLVPGEWMRKMCEPFWGKNVLAWPVGIDTDLWKPVTNKDKDIDILLYDKVLWNHDSKEKELIEPIKQELLKNKIKFAEIRYRFYQEDQYRDLLARSRTMIFLCEHETQGIAYQQALSCNVPILAWDTGGFWQDPSYFPHHVRFAPVSSVPYWDDRCGIKFSNMDNFASGLELLLNGYKNQSFSPRQYIIENLTLEKCAKEYLKIVSEIEVT